VVARQSLDHACNDLDEAVLALPDMSSDNVMANPDLVALLLRVVVARRHLSGVNSVSAQRALAAPGLGHLSRESCFDSQRLFLNSDSRLSLEVQIAPIEISVNEDHAHLVTHAQTLEPRTMRPSTGGLKMRTQVPLSAAPVITPSKLRPPRFQ